MSIEIPHPSETVLQSSEFLRPGDVISFADLAELVTYEDDIIAEIKPDYNSEVWITRMPLREFIKPPKFYGTVSNIELTVMGDPYTQLITASERGVKLGKGRGAYKISQDNEAMLASQYKGYVLTADAYSTGRGKIGQIQSELWYYPFTKNNCAVATRGSAFGMEIARAIASPRLEGADFITIQEDARRIGYQVLRSAMMRPILTPMQT